MCDVSFDPRAWNILAGLCLASGCGDRTIGADDTDGSESNTTDGTTETGGPECSTDEDCLPGYYCVDGICEYVPSHDGSWVIECSSDVDCDPLELCEYDYCSWVSTPPACVPTVPGGLGAIPIASLALTFADLDGDGSDALVIATQTELHVFDDDTVNVYPREFASDFIDAMAAGPLDAMPGDEVVIMVDDELHVHGWDGMGNFATLGVQPAGLLGSVELLVGEFDGEAPADMVICASLGAAVTLGSGDVVELSHGPCSAITARSIDDPLGGFAVASGVIDFYTAAGEAIASSEAHGNPSSLTSIEHLGDGFDLSSSNLLSLASGQEQGWSLIEQWGPATGNLGTRWGLLGLVTAMAGGDFNGDARADVGLIVDGVAQIHFGPLAQQTCLQQYSLAGVAADLAVGDNDGDGDDELAVRLEDGQIEVLPGE